MKYKAYAVGPHVFWPEQQQEVFYDKLESLCEKFNFTGLIPKDNQIESDGKSVQQLASLIYHKNIEMIKSCDIVVADITSFRGPSADSGSCYEIGYARALNKPVVMWTDDIDVRWFGRISDHQNSTPVEYKNRIMHKDKYSVEDFGLVDNLMITRPFDLVHCSVEDAFTAAWNLFNFKGDYDDNI